MNGVLLINKPSGMTSRDVVNFLVRKFHFKKIGHTGTLDPFATGLMLVTLGKATKASQFIEGLDKTYRAVLKLGIRTDTLDKDGKIIENGQVPLITHDKVLEVFKALTGDILQTPPMYSALKINGVRLYELARQGIEIERKERMVQIFDLELISFKQDIITFEVRCSKGTYVRTLGEQIAEKLNTIGHLLELSRIKISKFDLSCARTLEDVSEKDLKPVSEVIVNIEKRIIENARVNDVKNGKRFFFDGPSNVLLVDEDDNALAIYERQPDGSYRSLRGLF